MPSLKFFMVESGYGIDTREPFVEIRFEGARAQISPEEATDLALSILQAAESAWSDAFLVEYLQSAVGLDLKQAAQILAPFRTWRLERRALDEGSEP